MNEWKDEGKRIEKLSDQRKCMNEGREGG